MDWDELKVDEVGVITAAAFVTKGLKHWGKGRAEMTFDDSV